MKKERVYKCEYCGETGHPLKRCSKKGVVEGVDENLRESISSICGVSRVYYRATESRSPQRGVTESQSPLRGVCMVYEVYMDAREFWKNPKDAKFELLHLDNVRIIHSVEVRTSID